MSGMLIIDDMRVLKDGILDGWGDVNVVYARNSYDGLEELKSDVQWDVIHLDHDLGGEDSVKPALDYILEFADDFADVAFYVHTSNPYEKRSIHQQLERAGLFSVMVQPEQFFDVDYDLF